jgi:hypothetical protein
LHNEKIVLPDAASEYIGTLKSKGGVLADVVGLGKTVERKSAHRSALTYSCLMMFEVIGLTLTSQDEKLPEFDENGLFNTKASLGMKIMTNTHHVTDLCRSDMSESSRSAMERRDIKVHQPQSVHDHDL